MGRISSPIYRKSPGALFFIAHVAEDALNDSLLGDISVATMRTFILRPMVLGSLFGICPWHCLVSKIAYFPSKT